MYQLIIERTNGKIETHEFSSFSAREDYIMEHWDDSADWLVPCAWGGYIDIRDCY